MLTAGKAERFRARWVISVQWSLSSDMRALALNFSVSKQTILSFGWGLIAILDLGLRSSFASSNST